MKITIIGTAYPYRGGLAAYNERLAQQLEEEGHQVSVYTFSLQYPPLLFPGKTQLRTEKQTYSFRILRAINTINPFNWWKTGRKIRKERTDLVIIKYWLPFMGPCFGSILRLIRKNKHTRIISILDNVIPHQKRIGDRAFTNYFIKPVDGFIAMSNAVLQDLRQFTTTKPAVLSPHPLFDNFGKKISREEALSHLNLESNSKYILFFGLIRDYKGLDLLIEAFAMEGIIPEDIKLIIAGEVYSRGDFYQEQIRINHLEDRIIFHQKFIPDSQVKYYFCACDLVVQPYKTATQSGVTQIAYHFDKPMVVTNVGGLKEMCPDGKVGYVVSPEPEQIATAIRRFFQDEKTSGYMVLSIQEEKKKYSWRILTGNLMSLLEKINGRDRA